MVTLRINYLGGVINYEQEEAKALGQRLREAYGAPSMEQLLGFDNQQVQEALYLTTTAYFPSRFFDIAAEVDKTAKLLDDRSSELLNSAGHFLHAAEAYEALAKEATAQAETLQVALSAIDDLAAGSSSLYRVLDLTANHSDVWKLEKLVDDSAAERYARSVQETGAGFFAEDLERRDKTFSNDAGQQSLYGRTIQGLTENQQVFEAMTDAQPGPSFGPHPVNQFGEIAQALNKTVALLVQYTEPARTVTVETNDSEVSPSDGLSQIATSIPDLSEAVRIAERPLYAAMHSGTQLDREDLTVVRAAVSDLQAGLTRLAAAAEERSTEMMAESDALRTTAAETEERRSAVKEGSQQLERLAEQDWSTTVTTVRGVLDAFDTAELVVKDAATRIGAVEANIRSRLEATINDGDLSPLTALGLTSLPNEFFARTAITTTLVKRETFAIAWGEQALKSLDRGGVPAANGAMARHADDVIHSAQAATLRLGRTDREFGTRGSIAG